MKEFFEIDSQETLKEHYGVYPVGQNESSFESNALMLNTIFPIARDSTNYSFILESWMDEDDGISFGFSYIPANATLWYTSVNHCGTTTSNRIVYYEKIDVQCGHGAGTLEDKIKKLSGLEIVLNNAIVENPHLVANPLDIDYVIGTENIIEEILSNFR
jgi:hypothetical protein